MDDAGLWSQQTIVILTSMEYVEEFIAKGWKLLKPGTDIHLFRILLSRAEADYISMSELFEVLQHVTIRKLTFTNCMFQEGKGLGDGFVITAREIELDSCVYCYNVFCPLLRYEYERIQYKDLIKKITIRNIGNIEPPNNGMKTWTRRGEILELAMLGEAHFFDCGYRIRSLIIEGINEFNPENFYNEMSYLSTTNHFNRMFQFVERNNSIYKQCQDICMLLMTTKKYRNTFYYIPKEYILRIAEYIWNSRYDAVWFNNHPINPENRF